MKLYILFLILVLNILLFGLPIVVESSSFILPGSHDINQRKGRSSSASSVDSKRSGNEKNGFFGKLFGFFGRKNGGKKDKVSKESDLSFEKNDYSAQVDNYEVDSESSKSNIIVKKHSDFSPSSSNESSEPEQNIDESQQEKEIVSEESKSAPAPVVKHFADESSSDPKSESMKDGFISIYDEDYDEMLNKGAIPGIVSEESGRSSEYVGGEEQKTAVPEQSEVEESNREDVLRFSDSQILGEKSLQEGLPESVDLNEGSRSSIAKDVENEDSAKHKPSTVSNEENHYDASYESNLEEMEKSVSEYRAKFSEDFSDELPHETYDRLLNDALKHEASMPSNNQEKIKSDGEYSGSEHSEKSKTSQKEEVSGIEKYLEDTDDSKEGSEASTADLEDRTTITLDEGMPKYSSQEAATEEEPEDLEDFLANTDIKVPEASELSIKNDMSARVPSEYIREKSRSATEPLQMQEQESGSEKEFEQESEGEPKQDTEKESEREFDESKETSSKIEESSKPLEKSTGIISRISDSFKNFISSFGGSKKESEVTNKEESVSVPAEESQKEAVESSVKEESEKPEELPDNNKSRVKMLIEHFEKENARNVPAPIGVPRNRLGLRNTEGSSEKKNIDSLINFFENEDIKAKEEANKYKESIKKREMSRTEGSVRQLEQIPEEDLEEVQLESINVEESPESGEEREGEIMRAINGEQPSEISRVDSEGSDFTQTSNFDEPQEELSVPIAIPNIYEEGKLAGGLAWALGVGKYVCNSKSAFSSLISPPLSKNLLVSAPSQEQMAKLLRLSGGEASDIIMDLVSSVLAQN
ncbi:signal peptide containing protein [Cryptosporidium hominis]